MPSWPPSTCRPSIPPRSDRAPERTPMPWFEAAEAGVPLLLLLIPGLPLGLLGLVQLLALPMALGFELRAVMRRRRGMPTLWDEWPSVSIIVPARNAAPVIEDCV